MPDITEPANGTTKAEAGAAKKRNVVPTRGGGREIPD